MRTSAPAAAPKGEEGSVLSSIVGFAASVIADDGDEHGDGGFPVGQDADVVRVLSEFLCMLLNSPMKTHGHA